MAADGYTKLYGTRRHEGSGVSFRFGLAQGGTPIVALDLTDDRTIGAIRKREQGLLDFLSFVVDSADSIENYRASMQELETDWDYARTAPDEFVDRAKQALVAFLDNPYATDPEKSEARHRLAEIEVYHGQRLRKQVTQGVKEQLTKLRRKEYHGQRPELWLALIDRDGYECSKCHSQDDLTIDHIVPLSKGGTDDLINLRLLCNTCNSSKGDKFPQNET